MLRGKNKKILKTICCAMLCSCMIFEMSVFATVTKENIQEGKGNTDKDLTLWYDEPAPISGDNRMLESKLLPLGNGNLGSSVFGGVEKERIHFNDKTLWTGGPDNPDGTMNDGTQYQGGNRLFEFNEEGYNNLISKFDSNDPLVPTGNTGVSSTLFSNRPNLGSWQDFGDIYLDFSEMGSNSKNVDNYERSLDIKNAISEVIYDYNETTYLREHFVSYPDNVLVTRLSKDGDGKLDFDVELKKSSALSSNDATTSIDDNNTTIKLIGTLNGNKMKYSASLKVIVDGKESTVEPNGNSTIKVRNADEVVLIFSTGTDYKNIYPGYRTGETSEEVTNRVNKVINDAAKKGYNTLLENHVSDYKELFDRVSLDLNEIAPNVPTDELIENYRNGIYSKALEALVFQYGRYLTIASSREGSLPSNLAGLWSIGSPLWSGDYHFNVNVQMNYWPAFSTNLAECGKVFADYMSSLVIPGRKSAEMSIGAKTDDFETTPIGEGNGFMIHTANNPFGKTCPNGEEYYGWNPNGATWALQNAFDYYEFTKDKEYLESTIYPMVKEVANMWTNSLIESKVQKIGSTEEQRLVVAPSTSAEQGPMTVGTTYDQSLVWEIFEKAIKAANILEKDSDEIKIWTEMQSKLDPVIIGEGGQIKEWYQETTAGKYLNNGVTTNIPSFNRDYGGESHRHISHLVGLFPGTLINKDNTEEIEAAKVSLLERGFKATGWSKGHKLNLWARTLDSENTYKVVQSMLSTNYAGIMDNLFDSHGFGTDHEQSPGFQIEGNFGYTSGIAEMLLQSQLGYVQFLPTIPDEWSDGEVKGLVARGNFVVSEKWQNGLATEFTVQYNGDEKLAEFTGEYKDIKNAKVYENGKIIDVEKDDNNDRITFSMKKGATYKIDFSNVNVERIIEIAQELINNIHKDLINLKEELIMLSEDVKLGADDDNVKLLSDCIQKANIINSAYPKVIDCDEKVYMITKDNELTQNQIDQSYIDIYEIKNRMLKNDSNIDIYLMDKSKAEAMLSKFNSILKNNVVIFSKDSGEVDINDANLSLSTSEDNNYTIRYTLDGTDPIKTSTIYENPINLNKDNDNIIKAALFKGEQKVSEIFSEKYVNEKISFKSAHSDNYYNNNNNYSPDKAIDSDKYTRWATNDNTNSVDITLTFEDIETISALKFEQFVSYRNWTDTYEIKVLVNDEYVTVAEGDKLGDQSQGNGGDRAIKLVNFNPVSTSSIIISMKNCSNPSYYSIDAYNFLAEEINEKGDSEELNKVIEEASSIDKNDPLYVNAEEILRKAFDYSLENAKGVTDAKQSVMDSRTVFLKKYLSRLGFGEGDKTELLLAIEQASKAIDSGRYTDESIKRLNAVLMKAKELAENNDAKQPEINEMIKNLNEAIKLLEEKYYTESIQLSDGVIESGSWRVVPASETNSGNYYSTTKGSKLVYEFTGVGIKLYGVKNSDHGIMKLTLKKDGLVQKEEIIDCYETGRDWNAQLINWQDLDLATYTLEISHEGKREEATNSYIEIKDILVTKVKEDISTEPNYDLNNDGKVNIGDLAILSKHYGKNNVNNSEEWQSLKVYDLNVDNEINTEDMKLLTDKILGN
ncbi:glycosyl hydrolase family 95 catalytic domain-containing protein [Clostridium celatum]|nr:glycoside hydrolase N-terminal domain-containing protein [Clostridium celatum]MCE9655773.1 glycoside hydrolase N-terminal domain-containing protein [Clostridium celatum]